MQKLVLLVGGLCLLLSFASDVEAQTQIPLDDITTRSIVKDRRVLAHAPVRESDIFWEKRVWRVIETREKMNLAFMNPEAPFFEILTKAAINGEIKVYTSENDKFTYELDHVEEVLSRIDTVPVFDPETYVETIAVVQNNIFYEDIKRFRIKEVWYFDSKTSRMEVRILGIAPMQDVLDDQGNFRYEKPLFWIHYPSARKVFAQHKAFTEGNDASQKTWADVFEMRQFSSYIYKESNVRDNRLQEMYSGVDRLLEGEKISQEIFNFEHDLWSY